MRKLLFFILSLSTTLYADPLPEIRVTLNTSNALVPIYISKSSSPSSPFTSSYLEQLETILTYDFNYNGSTTVSAKSSDKEKLLRLSDDAAAFNISTWKNFGIAHVIRLDFNGKILTTIGVNIQERTLKKMTPIELSGNLNEDRIKIHKLADALHKTLLHEEGISSSKLLFAYQVKSKGGNFPWTSEIWECDWDGANARQITHENSYCVTPVFLPHHSQFGNDKFLYVSYKMGQPKIYLASIKEGTGQRLIDLRGNQLLPAISAKRDKIAFISDAGGRTDLFIQALHPQMAEAEKPVQLYSYPRSTQASPTFSPDGSTVAFVSDKDSGTRIYTLSTTAGEKRGQALMLTKINRENTCPSWSPDGKKLAYSAKTNGIRQIWIYDFVSKEELQLTTGPGNKENPCWAPNSRHLVFNSTDADNSELYVVNINQPDAIKITKGPGKKHYPAWGK